MNTSSRDHDHTASAVLEQALAELRTARVLIESGGYWRNPAGHMTDAALWIERAMQTLADASSPAQVTGEGSREEP